MEEINYILEWHCRGKSQKCTFKILHFELVVIGCDLFRCSEKWCIFLSFQYAGSHLKELQRAFQNPAANLGLIFGEGSKRALRSIIVMHLISSILSSIMIYSSRLNRWLVSSLAETFLINFYILYNCLKILKS